ncbi:hypothetical protein HI914_00154 [Erysiphe necator]|nr:hypothetical protein HI914_00154 [Erysiphe necator]
MASNLEMLDGESEIHLNTEALENLLDKANRRLLRHRDWLANLPRDTKFIPTIVHPPLSLVTAPPNLLPRQNPQPLPDCNDISRRAFEAGANSATVVFSASISGISATITSLNIALASAQASASVALSSATSSLLMAQLSMNSAVSAAERSASIMVASAVDSVASANAAANEARAMLANEIQKAEASIASNNQAARASIIASQTAAMNTTKFALSLTFAILGSSIVTIISFYLIMRLRKRRTEKRQAELKEKIHIRNTTPTVFPDEFLPRNLPSTENFKQPRTRVSQFEAPRQLDTSRQFDTPRKSDAPRQPESPRQFEAPRQLEAPRKTDVLRQIEVSRPRLSQLDTQTHEIKPKYDAFTSENIMVPISGREDVVDPLITLDSENEIKFSEYIGGENKKLSSNQEKIGDVTRSIENNALVQRSDSMARRHTEGFGKKGSETEIFADKHMTFSPSSSKSSKPPRSRKPTLQYDPERPRDPPTFLDDSKDDDTGSQSDDLSPNSNLRPRKEDHSQKLMDGRISAIGAAI